MKRHPDVRITFMTRWLARPLAVLCLASAAGCSRQIAAPGPPSALASSGQLPFASNSDGTGISPTADLADDAIPIGTEVSVQLGLTLSSADVRAGDSFAAVLDQPIVLAGKTVLPAGSHIVGTVLAAQAFNPSQDAGYLRLTLASITVNGKSLPLQTSSIFAKGPSSTQPKARVATQSSNGKVLVPAKETDFGPDAQANCAVKNRDVRFSTGHRLTFRLTEPLHLQN